MSQMLLLLGKASLLLSVTLLAAALLRRAPAATRHRLWTALFAAMLALPLLAIALPALNVAVPVGREIATAPPSQTGPVIDAVGTVYAPAGDATVESDRTATSGAAAPEQAVSHAQARSGAGRVGTWLATVWPGASMALLAVWVIGTTGAVGALGLSLLRVRRLARTADDVGDQAWSVAAATIGARLGLHRPARLFVSARVGTPMAGGVWRPAIFLPVSAHTWNPECRDVVLAHEMVHLVWRDPLRHLVTRLALAVYWFHPLAWIAARQAAIAREQACDEAVLALGTRRSAYARVLLDLADPIHPSARTLAALPMVQRSHLEKRLMTILNGDVRPATRRLILVPAIGVMLLTGVVAAVRPTPLVVLPGAAPASQDPTRPAPTPRPAPSPTAVPAPEPAVVATVTASPAAAVVPQEAGPRRDAACGWDVGTGSSFSGNISMTTTAEVEIREQVGRRGNDRIILKSFGDLRVCMTAESVGDVDRPSQWIGRARRVVLEARRGSSVQRLDISQASRAVWRANGQDRAFDAAAQQWRDRVLALLDTTWEIATLHGQVSSLHGEISSIHGQRSSLHGEISSLRGEVSSMRGEASSARGHESSLAGQISSIRGHLSSLHGAVSSEQGAISSLNASRDNASDAERTRIVARVAEHDAQIRKIEREIADFGADARIAAVERERKAYDADGKVTAIEARIKAFGLESKVAEVERRIQALDVVGKVAAIERQIRDLDADRRIARLEPRQHDELTRFEAAIAAIR